MLGLQLIHVSQRGAWNQCKYLFFDAFCLSTMTMKETDILSIDG